MGGEGPYSVPVIESEQRRVLPMSSTNREVELLGKMAAAKTTVETRAIAAELEEVREAERRRAEAARMSVLTVGHVGTRVPDAVAESMTHTSSTDSDWLMDVEVPQVPREEMEHAMRAEATVWLDRRPAEVRQDGAELRTQALSMANYLSNRYPGQREAAQLAFVDQIKALAVEDWARPGDDDVTVDKAEEHEGVEFEGEGDPDADPQAQTDPASIPSYSGGGEGTPPSQASRKTASNYLYVSDDGVVDEGSDLGDLVRRVVEQGYSDGYVTNQDGGRQDLSALVEKYVVGSRKQATDGVPASTCSVCGEGIEQEKDGSWSHNIGNDEIDHEAKPVDGAWPESSRRAASRKTAAEMVRDDEWAVLDAEFNEAFAALRASGLSHDADHPIARRYRDASDAVNHANRSRDWAIFNGESTASRKTALSGCSCAHNTDGSVTTMLCPIHASEDPCWTYSRVTGKRRKGSIVRGVCTNCGWAAKTASRKTAEFKAGDKVTVDGKNLTVRKVMSGGLVEVEDEFGGFRSEQAKNLTKAATRKTAGLTFRGEEYYVGAVGRNGSPKTAQNCQNCGREVFNQEAYVTAWSDGATQKVLCRPCGDDVERGVTASRSRKKVSNRKVAHNGWTNWDTWNAAMWINNEEGIYRAALGAESPEALRDLVAEFGLTGDGFDADKVNWDEVWTDSEFGPNHQGSRKTAISDAEKAKVIPPMGYEVTRADVEAAMALPSGSRPRIYAYWDNGTGNPQVVKITSQHYLDEYGPDVEFYWGTNATMDNIGDWMVSRASRKTAAEYQGGSPKEGDTATCHKDGGKIQFFAGEWMHLKGTGDSHNDVYPGKAKESSRKTATNAIELDVCVDCMMTAANGYSPHEWGYTPEVMPWREWDNYPGHPVAGDGEGNFSSQMCEGCGTRVAGDRYQAFWMEGGAPYSTASRKVDTSRRTAGGGEAWQAAQEGGHASQVEFALSMLGVPEDQIDSATQNFLAQWDGSGDAGEQAQQWYDSRTASRKQASDGWVSLNSGDPGAVRDIYEKVLPGGDSLEVSVDRQSGRASWHYVSREGYFTGGSGTEATLEAAKAAAEASLPNANAGHGPRRGSRAAAKTEDFSWLNPRTAHDGQTTVSRRKGGGRHPFARSPRYSSRKVAAAPANAWAYVEGYEEQEKVNGTGRSLGNPYLDGTDAALAYRDGKADARVSNPPKWTRADVEDDDDDFGWFPGSDEDINLTFAGSRRKQARRQATPATLAPRIEVPSKDAHVLRAFASLPSMGARVGGTSAQEIARYLLRTGSMDDQTREQIKGLLAAQKSGRGQQ